MILLGDGAVGKTSIANRFTDDKFAKVYKQTVGVDFFSRRLQLTRKITSRTARYYKRYVHSKTPSNSPNLVSMTTYLYHCIFSLLLRDIGGQSIGSKMITKYIGGAHVSLGLLWY